MTPENNPYDKTLSDRFWLTLWAKSQDNKQKLSESLQYAALTNRLWRAEYLLSEKKADVNTANGFCVRWAAESGHCEMIRLLARHGADINAKEGEALIRAAANGNVSVAKTLIESGADPTLRNFEALRLADDRSDAPMIRALLNSGRDFTVVAAELMEKAGGSGLFDKAGLYSQYLDTKKNSPTAGSAFKPPKP